eukprot:322255_1
MADGLSLFYSTWMDRAEKHQQAAKVLDDAENYDAAIALYKKSITSYQRALKFTDFEKDKRDITKICEQMINRIKQIAPKDLNNSESDSDLNDYNGDETEQKYENISIQIVSDIHLEFDGVYIKMPSIINKNNKASILALLGDIGYPKMDVYKQFIASLVDRYKYILIICGNHEYYKDEMYNVHSILKQIENKYKNVFFMHKRCIEFPDLSEKIRFIGTTLWVNYPKQIQYKAQIAVNDFNHIQIDENKLQIDINCEKKNDNNQIKKEKDAETLMLDELMGNFDEVKTNNKKENVKRILNVDDVNTLYDDQLKWIKSEIISAKKDKKYLIILTHHAPTSYKCISEIDRIDDIGFIMNFSCLEKLLKYPVISWCFGHTHKNCDFIVCSDIKNKNENDKQIKWLTRIVSNQLGYYDDDKLSFETNDYLGNKIITFPNIMNVENIEYIDRKELKQQLKCDKERINKLSQQLLDGVNPNFTVPI